MMAKRLIDANALRAQCDPPHWCVWMNEIDDAPTIDAVEVVRCGECEHFNNLTCKIRKGSWGEQLKVGFSDFCSDGKRRGCDGR